MAELLTIIGPTASGKTPVAAHLAHRVGGVVLSGDSRQVYQGMDLGTGKDLEDYVVDGDPVPYYLIDIAEAGDHYSLYQYLEDFDRVWQSLPEETPRILCGGSGLYVEAALRGYHLPDVPRDESLREELGRLSLDALRERAEQLGALEELKDPENRRRMERAIEVALYFRDHGEQYLDRPPLEGPIYCLDISRETRRGRISERLRKRLREGMVEEVEGLLKHLRPEQLTYYGLEYRYVTDYVTGKLTYDEMEQRLEVAIHQFAKRQMTWIRGMERRGLTITQITPAESPAATADLILRDYRQR
ncbi:tRNA (adenosine(37)-N6)-dimethylallyltransferase MiaA [Porphyromonas sp. HMSC065F10]|uniref:tRNA (adenosine(37)-N6)-dimethylallyltransferase n=1 Tax=Porphyromonas sp. HMSC065F10 TaxID=1739394 RepID=UPI0008A33BAF|nr:isopentenyl transferase family protein [Porphyromonas sp. HMSC065F10]OFR41808.1 tRNA dimethylallyltransferase [Porphyromonas sp. HMSC065F10]